jgi:cytosine/adenosine deaminase-related metal-dependent hydrolase
MNRPTESTIHSASWLISPQAAPLPGGAIVIRGGVITDAGSLAELRSRHAAPVQDHPGSAILPGFVNAHTHLELTHFPAWRLRNHADYHPRRFVDWIIQLIKVKRGLTASDMQASAMEGVRMCLESGTTAVGEIVTTRGMEAFYRSSRLSGRLFLELVGQDQPRFRNALKDAVDAAGAVAEDAFAPGLSPHSVYTIAESNLPLIREAALAAALPLAIHCSESRSESDFIFDSSGPLAEDFYPFVNWERYLTPPRRCSSVELLDRHGLLLPSTLLIHCVHVTRADAEILRQAGVSIALCPRSNERLDVGKAPVALLKKLGIPLSLGTDSLASNDSLSLWDELRFAADTFAEELSPADLFRMVTSGGSAALGIGGSHGSLEAGKRADFQIVGHFGDGERNLLERVMLQGVVEDVYVAGMRYGADPGLT